MTEVAIVQTDLSGREAGEALGAQIRSQLTGPAHALIVFAAPGGDHAALLEALAAATGTRTVVGCSSAGEFTDDGAGNGLTNVTAIRSTSIRFAASIGYGLSTDAAHAARDIATGFRGASLREFPFRAALVLVDALAGHTEELIDTMTVATAGAYRFFGGGAGDDARFGHTSVFCGTEVVSDAAVALEMVSKSVIGIGARHGWTKASAALRVTQADGSRVVSLNAAPAVEAFEEYAGDTAQSFDRADPMPFFLHNIVGVATPGGFKLRVPLGVSEDGCVACAAEVPAGTTTHIMSTTGGSAAEAAGAATRDAVEQVTRDGGTPKAALFFDCVATRLRLGAAFDDELATVSQELGGIPFAGFNSYGQIVRAEGQFSGFHNCTAVVCVLPD
ncbi:MAG: FIST N-terminal domain-containing protein [bacterium]